MRKVKIAIAINIADIGAFTLAGIRSYSGP
jgi:hypothetical protein